MRSLTITNPNRIVFGSGCFNQLILDLKGSIYKNIFVVTVPQLRSLVADTVVNEIVSSGKKIDPDSDS